MSAARPGQTVRILCLILFGLLYTPMLRAQVTRNERIAAADVAWGNLDYVRAQNLLTQALDPKAGPADSTWAKGVQLLGQILIDGGKPALAGIWLRWGFRYARDLSVDSLAFTPELVTAATAARNAVGARSASDAVTRTSWDWPAAPAADTTGRIRITSTDLTAPIVVLVRGPGVVQGMAFGQSFTLPAGTYQIQATAAGYLSAGVSREVLPGVTTVLGFDLVPVGRVVALPDSVLPDAVADAMRRRLVKLTVERYGIAPTCVTGFLVGRAGMVVTSYRALRGVRRVSAQLPGGVSQTEGVAVAAHNVARDLVLLRLTAADTDTLTFAQTSGTQTAWAGGFDECGEPQFTRVRTASAAGGSLSIASPLSSGHLGGPLLNQDGSVIGVVVRTDSAVSTGDLPAFLTQGQLAVQRSQFTSFEEVGRTEKHLFGGLIVRSTADGASARVRPLDPWQWPEVAREGPVPLEFVGPMGRYAVELVIGGQVRGDTVVSVGPGVRTDVTISLPAVVATKRKSRLPFILIGGAGAAAAAVVLLRPKGPVGGTGDLVVETPVNPTP